MRRLSLHANNETSLCVGIIYIRASREVLSRKVGWAMKYGFAVFCLYLFFPTGLLADNRPNIVLILADDLGYGEVAFQGHPHARTPNIDSIAKNGVRFTAGYNAATYCSPSRAGLLTGKYPTRFGFEFNAGKAGCGLPTNQCTLAERLRRLGYATACFGKWDLGHNQQCWMATSRGFDVHFGTAFSSPLFVPGALIDSQRPTREAAENHWTMNVDPNFYLTTTCANRAVEWMQDQPADKPLFLYVPFNATHNPLEVPQAYLDRFAELDEPMKTFCATLSAMDDAVGMILDALKREGRYDNTLVIFLSDNGAPSSGPLQVINLPGRNAPFRGCKGTTLEGGIRVPFIAQWPDRLPVGLVYDEPVINLDIVPTAVSAAGGTCEAGLDGVNLLPYLTGKTSGRPHETLYWRQSPQWAVRHGDWKLGANRIDAPLKARLYNLRGDVEEKRDLADVYPSIRDELQAAWNQWNKEQMEPLWTEGSSPKGGPGVHQSHPSAAGDLYLKK